MKNPIFLAASFVVVGCLCACRIEAPSERGSTEGVENFRFDSLVAADECVAESITERLSCIRGLAFVEVLGESTTPEGYRRFDLMFEQPLDHANPERSKFKQKLVLLHKGESEPMVLQTSGYAIFRVSLSGIAREFSANQIQVEHRFFGDSVPEDKDWAMLNIRQSAADFHRITMAFRQIYSGKWLNTGASKGGMTSVYHRRFFPADLDGTLAYVAPLSFSTNDDRYPTFVDAVGGEQWAACRTKLEDLQKGILEHRDDIVPSLSGTFAQLGTASIALEHAVLELPFAFWQYQSPTKPEVGCDLIPARDAPASEQKAYLEAVNSVESGYGDAGLAGFIPYYYQAAGELGAPASKMNHLGDLLQHRETYDLKNYLPKGITVEHAADAMRDINDWVRTESQGIMFVYGEYDPWSAGPFTQRPDSDSFFYVQSGGNHGANVFALAASDKSAALATLARWLNKELNDSSVGPGQSLEEQEFIGVRHGRLP